MWMKGYNLGNVDCVQVLHNYLATVSTQEIDSVDEFGNIPLAETGDCSDGVTITSNDLLDDPPTSSSITTTDPSSSEPKNLSWINCTEITARKNV